MGDLSKNFSRIEFACRCGCGFNTVDAELLRRLQELSNYFNNAPVVITGPNRCQSHNLAEGGAPESQHTRGKAADLMIKGIKPFDIYKYFDEKFPDKYGLGIYSNRIHIDVRETRARWNQT